MRTTPINERQADLLRIMILENKAMFTIREVQTMFGVVYQTARTDLIGLQQLGFLEEKKQGKKMLFFKTPSFDSKMQNIQRVVATSNGHEQLQLLLPRYSLSFGTCGRIRCCDICRSPNDKTAS
jgi:hypothetical protein